MHTTILKAIVKNKSKSIKLGNFKYSVYKDIKAVFYYSCLLCIYDGKTVFINKGALTYNNLVQKHIKQLKAYLFLYSMQYVEVETAECIEMLTLAQSNTEKKGDKHGNENSKSRFTN